jgi:DNA-3-methyladenine glycosylase II
LQERSQTEPLAKLTEAELWLSERDRTLADIIATDSARWPSEPTEDPIWGLIRMVIAQQISTRLACRFAEELKELYPELTSPTPGLRLDHEVIRTIGIPARRARCCVEIASRSQEIRSRVVQGQTWEEALSEIKGIGPWTIAVFRIMVLRDPDQLPVRDLGLQRAVKNAYGELVDLERLGDTWRPFRSVACWYLWRTLGNEQLG